MNSAAKVVLLLIGVLFGLTSARCPKGFAAVKNSCIRISHNNWNWNDAWADCAKHKGFLVEFAEFSKMVDVVEYLNTLDANDQAYWVGAGDGIISNDWRWIISGAKVSESANLKWCEPHMPDNTLTTNAMVLYPYSVDDFCWIDNNAGKTVLDYLGEKLKLGYICEAVPTNAFMRSYRTNSRV